MKIKRLIPAAALVFLAGVCNAEPYKVIAPLPSSSAAMAQLVNFDTGVAMDSVKIVDGIATFTGQVDEPLLARVQAGDVRTPVFILESGTISFSKDNSPFGTMLNDQFRQMVKELAFIQDVYKRAHGEKESRRLEMRYNAVIDSTMNANVDNAMGYYIFISGEAPQLDAATLRKRLEQYPSFAAYERPKRYLEAAERREALQPGGKFADFEVTYDGKTTRLSDYVGKGDYVLVDFWASWCGPCIRQTAVLKQLYEKYKDKGLKVLGVAVWDEPEATLEAIKKHDLPWDNIINAGTIPTDLYSITGIPCIILFGPDGTILSRDKQNSDLVADVDAAMAGK